ncbi:hypothetical protein Bca52824_023423 [Brassica carinata]|uniref:Uncharacterized protein n=1 Tax=Brassica carinata TaxID=52824 RepID=A0A8X7VIF9_BRACI|nr:hypothetical protein Bca52824_023423 [Brassica carinata]
MTEPVRGTRSFEWCWRRPDRVDKSGKGHPVGKKPARRTAGDHGLKFQVPMGRNSEADIEVEKQERGARHTAQFGKSLGSQPGSEEEPPASFGNARKKAQAKKDGNRVVADKGVAPPKRAKAQRNSSVGALVVENTNNKGDHALAHTMRAMTPPRRAPDPVQENVESLHQHNMEELSL